MENKGKPKEKSVPLAEQTGTPLKWELSDEDRLFLRSCNISPE